MEDELYTIYSSLLSKIHNCTEEYAKSELCIALLSGQHNKITNTILKTLVDRFVHENKTNQVCQFERCSGKTTNIIAAHIACLDAGHDSVIVNPGKNVHYYANVPRVMSANNLRGSRFFGTAQVIFIDEYWHLSEQEILSICQMNMTASILALGTHP